MFGPHPRFRLYTTLKSYTSFLGDLLSGRIAKGADVERLEEALCRRFNVTHAVCVPMARVGIYLTLKSLIPPGSRVVMSPYTIADVVNMVIAAQGKPLFADIERTTCNISPAEVDRLLDADTGAVLATHLHGISARTHELRDLCENRNVALVEDAAQAFGAVQHGTPIGTIGDAGIYSFGTYKNLNAWYGGAVVTNNDELALRIRAHLSDWTYQSTAFLLKRIKKGLATDILTFPPIFRMFTFWVFRLGYLHEIEWINRRVRTELDTTLHTSLPASYQSRLTPFQARLAIRHLSSVDTDTQERIHRAQLYHDGLCDLPELVLPPPPNDLQNTYSYYAVQYHDRSRLLKQLMRRDRDIAPQHLKNCADLSAFCEFHRDCPNARTTANATVLLPTYPRYAITEVNKNIDQLREAFSQNNG